MTITIVGAKGVVGVALVQFFKEKGYLVHEIDKDNCYDFRQFVEQSDAVWVVTLPIEEVGERLIECASVMRPGAYLIHGCSIENPQPKGINYGGIEKLSVHWAHVHFQFRPEEPLSQTILGQTVTVSVSRDGANLERWLKSLFKDSGCNLLTLPYGHHDGLTGISQIIHMIVSFLVARVWLEIPTSQILTRGLRLGGPPARMLARTVLRTAGGASVAEAVLRNHPHRDIFIRRFGEALSDLKGMIVGGGPEDKGRIKDDLLRARDSIEPDYLGQQEKLTGKLIRLEADLCACNYEFVFSQSENRPGLLAQIMEEFNIRSVHMTTTIAQENADGGCTITVAVRNPGSNSEQARDVINGLRELKE